ncbi:hypothetical protein CLF_106331 [Clonorchis sinensis]|uniref:Uncharacterized protein n=1 Tax=Clonorchis sinensis TaxID=79923 RepID=G7YPW7_CLOSI|nr:hypothetical protein CLF_106331 [Clonorchis sinensis]
MVITNGSSDRLLLDGTTSMSLKTLDRRTYKWLTVKPLNQRHFYQTLDGCFDWGIWPSQAAELARHVSRSFVRFQTAGDHGNNIAEHNGVQCDRRSAYQATNDVIYTITLVEVSEPLQHSLSLNRLQAFSFCQNRTLVRNKSMGSVFKYFNKTNRLDEERLTARRLPVSNGKTPTDYVLPRERCLFNRLGYMKEFGNLLHTQHLGSAQQCSCFRSVLNLRYGPKHTMPKENQESNSRPLANRMSGLPNDLPEAQSNVTLVHFS